MFAGANRAKDVIELSSVSREELPRRRKQEEMMVHVTNRRFGTEQASDNRTEETETYFNGVKREIDLVLVFSF